ncbi:sigma-70 family RNA polymerase sigma factor [Pseudomonas matsuisoli]|uniref:RNA polymerase sigma factor n=1 Tax=Pseudomonas matsuisoli TaxID=1515666 RepID=A0A917UY98_9PSED|nr:sigma-70 family RNA polymerase sigma factor [Pseudomonas matsuisoli]GGJ95567.1 RNA polymerase sigma factor [Pseudomonas matsuisoli]
MTVSDHTLGQIYRAHGSWLRNWLYQRLGCSAQAADLAQDTFVRILQAQRKSGYSPDLRQPRAYLATVGRRLICDHFRRQSLESAYLEALAREPELLAISPEAQLQMRQALFELDALLDNLKPIARQVFLLSQLEGLSYAEIARQLAIGERTVKRHMALAFETIILHADAF